MSSNKIITLSNPIYYDKLKDIHLVSDIRLVSKNNSEYCSWIKSLFNPENEMIFNELKDLVWSRLLYTLLEKDKYYPITVSLDEYNYELSLESLFYLIDNLIPIQTIGEFNTNSFELFIELDLIRKGIL